MTEMVQERLGTSRQRGFWLRCFLRAALLLGATFMQDAAIADAMTCVSQRNIHVAALRGQVFDPSGVPIPGVVLTISKDGHTVSSWKSNINGGFDLKGFSGEYEIHAESPGFMPFSLSTEVGSDLSTLLHPKSLKVILGLGGTTCGFATTSQRQFKNEVKYFRSRSK